MKLNRLWCPIGLLNIGELTCGEPNCVEGGELNILLLFCACGDNSAFAKANCGSMTYIGSSSCDPPPKCELDENRTGLDVGFTLGN